MQPTGICNYVYDSAEGRWVPQAAGGGGGDTATNVVLSTPDGLALWQIAPDFLVDDIPASQVAQVVVSLGAGFSLGSSTQISQYTGLTADGDAQTAATGNGTQFHGAVARLQGYNGATFDRLRSFAGNADNVTAPTLGLLGQAAFTFLFDGTNFDRLRSVVDNADALAVGVVGLAGVMAKAQAFNGTSYDRVRTNSAATLSASTQPFGMLCAAPGEWSINHTPAANTQATITRAAGAAGVRHVCRSISATLIGLAASAEATVLVNLRDGATGAGTILRSWRLLVVGGTASEVGVELSGLNILGSAATAMTIEFAAAAGADTFETVALSGYDTI